MNGRSRGVWLPEPKLLAKDGTPMPAVPVSLSARSLSEKSVTSDSPTKWASGKLNNNSIPYETLSEENLLKVAQLDSHDLMLRRKRSRRQVTTATPSDQNSEAISAKANRQALVSCSFRKYQYPVRKAPGFDLFRLLSKATATGPRSLRLLIPDTVVYGLRQDGGPTWLYTNADGIIRTSTAFLDKQIVDRLGNRRYEDDLVVVSKEPKYLPQLNGSVTFDGNEASVVSTRVLKQMLMETSSLQGNPLVLQRYIKSKGGKARIVRSAWYARKPSRVWLISNTARYTDKPTGNHRNSVNDLFVTNTHNQSSVSVYDVTGSAKEEFEKQNLQVLAFLEITMKKRLDELVLDCIKDDFDQIWVLQIKAYKVHEEDSLKPKGEESDDSMSDVEQERTRKGGGTRANSHGQRGQSNNQKGDRGHSGLFNRKCRFCSVIYPLQELRYKMTTQMILDTTAHLRSRIPAARYKALLASQAGGDLGMDASRLYYAHHVCRTCFSLYHAEKELAMTESIFARALGMPVQVHPVLDTSDDMLKCGGDRISRVARSGSVQGLIQNDETQEITGGKNTITTSNSVVLSPINSPTSPSETHIQRAVVGLFGSPKAPGSISQKKQSRLNLLSPTGDAGGRMSTIVSGVLKKAFRGTTDKKSILGGGAASPTRPGQPVVKSISDVAGSMPPQVTLCRCLIAIHELHDLAKPLVNRLIIAAKRGVTTIIRCTVLNKEYDIPVDLTHCRFSKFRSRLTSILPLHVFRVYSFFSGDTPLRGPLPERSGIAQMILNQRRIGIKFLQGSKGNWTELGSGSVPLEQFRSDYVKSLEMFVPLGVKLGLCQVKVSVGIERTRSRVDSSTIQGVKFHQGVYVPHSLFHTGDPLPSEWMTTLQVAPPQIGPEIDADVEDDERGERATRVSYAQGIESTLRMRRNETASDLILANNRKNKNKHENDKNISKNCDKGSNNDNRHNNNNDNNDNDDDEYDSEEYSADNVEEDESSSNSSSDSTTKDTFEQGPDQVSNIKVAVTASAIRRGGSFRSSNPLSPSGAVNLPKSRQNSTLFKRLNNEEALAMNKALGLPPGSALARHPSFPNGLLLTSDREGNEGSGGEHPGSVVEAEMSRNPSRLTIPRSGSQSARTIGSGSDQETEECIWSLRLKIDSAHNVALSKDLLPYKRWHVYFDLFNQRHRTSVATLSNGTLKFNYSQNHYVWATSSSLAKHFEKESPVKLILSRSMELDQSRRLDMLEAVFKVADGDGNGCVTHTELLQVLSKPKSIYLMMEGRYVKPSLSVGAAVSGHVGVAARRRAAAAEAKKRANKNNSNNSSPKLQSTQVNEKDRVKNEPLGKGRKEKNGDTVSPLGALFGPMIKTLSTSLQELWQNQPDSHAALEACTVAEFNNIGTLVLHFHELFKQAQGPRNSETKCCLDKLIEILVDQEKHGEGLDFAATARERKTLELCRAQLKDDPQSSPLKSSEKRSLDWMCLLNLVREAGEHDTPAERSTSNGWPERQATLTRTNSISAHLYDLQRAKRQDKESYTCMMPLAKLTSHPDATVEDTFDLVCTKQDKDPSEAVRHVLAQNLGECCEKVRKNVGSEFVPMQRIRDVCKRRFEQKKSSLRVEQQETLLTFLDSYYQQGRTNFAAPPATLPVNNIAGDGVENEQHSLTIEVELPRSEEKDDDILSSSRSGSQYSEGFEREFLRSEWNTNEELSEPSQSRKSSVASSRVVNQEEKRQETTTEEVAVKREAKCGEQHHLVNVKTLLQAFAMLQARQRRESVSHQSLYPPYMCAAVRLHRTETRREAMSPSRNASLAKLDEDGNVKRQGFKFT